MPRGLLFVIILLLVVIGGAILLSRGVKEQPTQMIEVEVPGNAAPR